MPTPLRSVVLPAAALLACAACAGGPQYSPSNPAPWDPESITYADSLAVDLTAMQLTPAGLYIEDLTHGEGATAQTTSLVSVHYIGYLPDGTIFDASVGGDPFQFRLGANEVIRGWNLGVPGMREGGIRRLVIRPALGYRGRAMGRIPPNTTLVFDMKLLTVR
jgi:peptidylprolyl isomerase